MCLTGDFVIRSGSETSDHLLFYWSQVKDPSHTIPVLIDPFNKYPTSLTVRDLSSGKTTQYN